MIAMLVYLYVALGKDIKELPIYTTYLKNETLLSGCTIVISQSLIDVVGDIKRSLMVYYILVGFFPLVAYHYSVDYDSDLGRASAQPNHQFQKL